MTRPTTPRTSRLPAGAAIGLLMALALSNPAGAHQASDAFLNLTVTDRQIDQRVDIALRDLDRDLVLDADNDGQLTWGEVRQQAAAIERLAADGIRLAMPGQACTAGALQPLQLTQHSDGTHAVLTRRWTCAQPLRALSVDYRLFADSDATHRGIVQLRQGEVSRSQVLVPGAGPVALLGGGTGSGEQAAEADADAPRGFGGFVAEGVHHILIGYDHILFLMALLLPAVLVLRPGSRGPGGGASARAMLGGAPGMARRGLAGPVGGELAWASVLGTGAGAAAGAGGARAAALHAGSALAAGRWRAGWAGRLGAAPVWSAALRFTPVLLDVARVVTAFTVAHSITLALAVLDVVDPPSRWVESIIAASVLLAALNNLRPLVGESRWKLTFAFGLVHGFGFAGALKDLGLRDGDLALSLLGFNAGVELGQLLIVAAFLPLAWALRRTALYRRGCLQGGSVLIAVLAALWLAERLFDLQLLPGG